MADRRHRPWTLGRVLTRMAVLLALGFIVNVLVAWGCAARYTPPSFNIDPGIDLRDPESPYAGRHSAYQWMSARRTLGTITFSVHSAFIVEPSRENCPACKTPRGHPEMAKQRWSLYERVALPLAWLDHHCESSGGPYRTKRTTYVSGWPMPSMAAAWAETVRGGPLFDAMLRSYPKLIERNHAAIFIDNFQSVHVLTTGDQLRYVGSPAMTRQQILHRWILLPLRPILIGAAINSILFATLIAMLVYGIGFLRRFIRHRKGRCTKCGYDLLHDYVSGCPECGWNKPDARVVAS